MTTVQALLAGAEGERRRALEVLIGHVLGKSRAWLYTHADAPLPGVVDSAMAPLIARLRDGEPVAYLIGRREFWGLDFEVNRDVLIPRPETELVIELALDRLPRRACVLDLGTGSGAIAIALAHARRDCVLTATDVSTAALAVARRNAQRLDAGVTFLATDWYTGLHRFDAILSNPPYVRSSDPHLAALRYEPVPALIAGVDGLDAIRRIVAEAPLHLNAGGHLIVEHGFDQGPSVRQLFSDAGFTGVETFSDLGGRERVTLGANSPRTNAQTSE